MIKKNTYPAFFALFISVFLLTACGGSDSDEPFYDKVVGTKLLPPEDDQIYFGAFTDFGDLEDDVTTTKIEKFDKLIDGKKSIAWSYFSNNWTKHESYEKPHIPEIRYPKEAIHTIHNAGKTPFVRLMPWTSPHILGNPSKQARLAESALDLTSVCFDTGKRPHRETLLITKSELSDYLSTDAGAIEGPCMNDFSLQNIIDGNWDEELRQWANDSIKDTQDNNGEVIPLLVTFTVEMEGSWFPWCGIYNGGAENTYKPEDGLADGPERFRDAYRHIIDLFKEEGANHITWFFSPNIIRPNETWMKFYNEPWNHPKNYYPGDDYIDWIGTTVYGPSGINSGDLFSKRMSEKFYLINEVTENKPLALLEFGAFEKNINPGKSEWFKDMFATILSNDYIKFSAISYWDDSWGDLNTRIDSSDESLLTFRDLIGDERFTSELRFSE